MSNAQICGRSIGLNGYRFTASEKDAAQAVLELASGNLDETGYSSFLRGNVARQKKLR